MEEMKTLSGPALQSQLTTLVQRITTRREMSRKSASGVSILALASTSQINERKVAKAVLAAMQVPIQHRAALAETARTQGTIKTLPNTVPYHRLPGTIELASAPIGDDAIISSIESVVTAYICHAGSVTRMVNDSRETWEQVRAAENLEQTACDEYLQAEFRAFDTASQHRRKDIVDTYARILQSEAALPLTVLGELNSYFARESQTEKVDMDWDEYEVILHRMYERARKMNSNATPPKTHLPATPPLAGTPTTPSQLQDTQLQCEFSDRETNKTCGELFTFTAHDQQFFLSRGWGPPNACPHHRALKKKMKEDKEKRESGESAGLHHAASKESDEDSDASEESSSGDTDYEDKCPDNY
jgi:hypothetical protein